MTLEVVEETDESNKNYQLISSHSISNFLTCPSRILVQAVMRDSMKQSVKKLTSS